MLVFGPILDRHRKASERHRKEMCRTLQTAPFEDPTGSSHRKGIGKHREGFVDTLGSMDAPLNI